MEGFLNMTYKEKKCDICNKEFAEGEDIVVCPECGTPYHRECYEEVGKCVHEDMHNMPQAEDDGAAEETDKGAEEKTEKCRVCGYELRENALFCDRCGSPVTGSVNQAQSSADKEPKMVYPPFEVVNLDEEIEDGVRLEDVSRYVKVNKQYYTLVFSRIKKFKLSRFNFCAFLFSGGWLLYRKQYLKGAIISIIIGALMLSSSFIFNFYSSEIVSSLLQTAGISSLTVSDFQSLYPYVESLGRRDMLILVLPYILELIRYIIMFVIGAKANKMYLKNCVKQVKEIKKQDKPEAQVNKELEEKGGVNSAIALCMLVCYILISVLPAQLMG